MTAHDLGTLATRLIKDFPEYYPIFAEKTFTFNKIKQDNRNPLIWQNIQGADGLKTGHTEEGGYGEVGSAQRNGRRIVVVLNGMPSIKARAEESEKLIEWAFREFDDYNLFKAGDTVTDADVWLGMAPTVPLAVAKDVSITLSRSARREMKVTVEFTGPSPAPIKKGASVGTLNIAAPGMSNLQLPLVAGSDVERMGVLGRMGTALRQILWGSKG
jgi:D-alanyl-D-alanine carboxypeptidase (penicillin-binding protein 5/6)